MSRERRYKLAIVGENAIWNLFAWPRTDDPFYVYVPTFKDLPADCEVVSVHHSDPQGAFAFTLYHPSFPEVPDGAYVPDLPYVEVTAVRVRREEGHDEPVIVE